MRWTCSKSNRKRDWKRSCFHCWTKSRCVWSSKSGFECFCRGEKILIFYERLNLIFILLNLKVNPITNPTDIAPFISNQIDLLYVHFYYEVIPLLFKLLEVFKTLRETIPFELHDCVNAAVARLNDEALVLRNTVELCWKQRKID